MPAASKSFAPGSYAGDSRFSGCSRLFANTVSLRPLTSSPKTSLLLSFTNQPTVKTVGCLNLLPCYEYLDCTRCLGFLVRRQMGIVLRRIREQRQSCSATTVTPPTALENTMPDLVPLASLPVHVVRISCVFQTGEGI